MRHHKEILLLVVAFLLMALEGQAVAQQPSIANGLAAPGDFQPSDLVISKRVEEVNLVFTVTDKRGRFVSNLPQDSFDLLDNQKQPSSVGYFQQQSNLPLHVALLIDLSDSIRGRFKFEQQAASEFLKRILRPDKDRALLVGFDGEVHLKQDFTGDPNKLREGIDSMESNGNTALYDALTFSCDRLRDVHEKSITRRAVILISDGLDTASKHTLNDAQTACARAEVVMYALSTNTLLAEKYPKGDAVMDLLTLPTGGHILPAREKSDLKQAFLQIEKALRSQYAVGYHPADFNRDGSFRLIEVRAKKKGVKVQCRKGYFAPREKARQ